ncbi:MAG: RAMP superfamily CRISPR-associated protein [Nostoc sp.]
MVHGNNNPPSPWLDSIGEPNPSSDASFIEYLRWMRLQSPNKSQNALDSAKMLELLQRIDKGDYSVNLEKLIARTKKLAHDWFVVECPWRIRVGGSTAPESMLLPAFDSLGMPYIPSSTFKGVARAVAKREGICAKEIRRIFGDINPETSMGIVTFLDAYPLPGEDNRGGLKPDMANAIWTWDKNNQPQYKPNPNVFLSLLKPNFVIGLRKGVDCDDDTLQKVKQWLLKGLLQGIGSRINSGYGELKLGRKDLNSLPPEKRPKKSTIILRVPFELQGQLIHGYQRINWNWNLKENNWEAKPQAVAEVRPIAFRSMLRYWFRAFALGVLPKKQVRELEILIFGGIEPKAKNGLFQIEVINSNNYPKDHHQDGILILRQSLFIEDRLKSSLSKLLNSLTWIMFHLGGIGQGARRPYYQRQGNPTHRGVDLIPKPQEIKPDILQNNWKLPPTPKEFQVFFQQQLEKFYSALGVFLQRRIDYRQPRQDVVEATAHTWLEAVDINCEILVIRKASRDINSINKPYPLEVLHKQFHNLESNNYTTAKSLCGGIKKESIRNGDDIDRDVIASPIWIANLQKYQVVTVFGANQDPRKEYLNTIKRSITNSQNNFDCYAQIFPIQDPKK